jgi:hypothetical protein
VHDPLSSRNDASEVELQKTPVPAGPAITPARSRGPWLVAAVVLVAGLVAAYLLLGSRSEPDTVVVTAPPAADTPVAAPGVALGPEVEPIELPPLGSSDALVRSLVRALSTNPRVVAWLTTDHLIRNFVVVVDNIAAGDTPARHLHVLRPADTFEAMVTPRGAIVHPSSYERYTPVAAGIASIDPVGAARLYATLKPRIEEASRELGHAEPFDRILERAIFVLLNTPAPNGQLGVVPQGGIFVFEDPAIERLSAAQKQFLRMGAQNVRATQAHLQAIALALGVKGD